MARSLASAAFRLLVQVLGGEGPQLPMEGVDARLHRGRLSISQHDHDRNKDTYDDDSRKIEEIGHQDFALTSLMAVASIPQSLPPAHVSFFHMGTDDFRVSMQ